MIEQIRNIIVKVKAEGVATILVEQRVDAVLSIADHVTLLKAAKILRRCQLPPYVMILQIQASSWATDNP